LSNEKGYCTAAAAAVATAEAAAVCLFGMPHSDVRQP
jgi:hypothetical protein